MAERRQAGPRARVALDTIRVVAALGWVALAYVVFALEPEQPMNVAALLAAVGVAAGGTSALLAYSLSFRLFTDPRFRGNIAGCAWQGIATGPVFSLAVGLLIARVPPVVVAGVTLVLLGVAQVVVLLHERGPR